MIRNLFFYLSIAFTTLFFGLMAPAPAQTEAEGSEESQSTETSEETQAVQPETQTQQEVNQTIENVSLPLPDRTVTDEVFSPEQLGFQLPPKAIADASGIVGNEYSAEQFEALFAYIQATATPDGKLAYSLLAQWRVASDKAHEIIDASKENGSNIDQTRADLQTWVDTLDSLSGVNGPRINTLQQELNTLGQPPGSELASGGTVPPDSPTTAAIRTELNLALESAKTPSELANTAKAEALGLIAEIDTRRNAEKRQILFEQALPPLKLSSWKAAIGELIGVVQILALKAQGAGSSKAGMLHGIPLAAFALSVIGVIMIVFAGKIARALSHFCENWAEQDNPVVLALRDISLLVFRVGGIALVCVSVIEVGSGSPDWDDFIYSIGWGATYIATAIWLVSTLKGHSVNKTNDLVSVSPEFVKCISRSVIALSACAAITTVMTSAFSTRPDSKSILALELFLYPVLFVYGVNIWHISKKLVGLKRDPSEEFTFVRAISRTFGWLGQILTVVAVVLIIFSYLIAANALFERATYTIALLLVSVLTVKVIARILDYLAVAEKARQEGRKNLGSIFVYLTATAILLIGLSLIWLGSFFSLQSVISSFKRGINIAGTQIHVGDVLTAIIIFIVGYWVTRAVKSLFSKVILPKTSLAVGAQTAIVILIGYVGYTIAFFVAVASLGIDLSNIALIASALSVGVGFGVSTIVNNFVSGLIILIERPIVVGDWIEVGDANGYVRKISVRSTTIETTDKAELVVPNETIVTKTLTNFTRSNLVGRIRLRFLLDYFTDIDTAIELLRDIAERHPMVLMHPGPSIKVRKLDPDGVLVELRVLIRDLNFHTPVQTELYREILKEFNENGIAFFTNESTALSIADPVEIKRVRGEDQA